MIAPSDGLWSRRVSQGEKRGRKRDRAQHRHRTTDTHSGRLSTTMLIWRYIYTFVWLLAYADAAPAPVPVPNPYAPRQRGKKTHRALPEPAGTPGTLGCNPVQGATIGAKRGRPKGSKNKDGAKKPGRNARTASAEEAVKNTPSIASMWSPRDTVPSPIPSGNPPSPSASAPSPSAPNSSSGGGLDGGGSGGGIEGNSGGGRDGGGSDGGSGGSSGDGSTWESEQQESATSSGSGGSNSDTSIEPGQRRFIDEIKSTVKSCRKHVKGGVTRVGEFPYSRGWAHPPLPTLQKAGCEWFYRGLLFITCCCTGESYTWYSSAGHHIRTDIPGTDLLYADFLIWEGVRSTLLSV